MELQVLPDSELLVQRAFLENDPDVLADLGLPLGHVVPVDPQGPACLLLDGAKGVDGRALPRPVGPQEGEDAAFLHGKGNVVHGRKGAVFLGEAFDFDAIGRHAAFSSGLLSFYASPSTRVPGGADSRGRAVRTQLSSEVPRGSDQIRGQP